MLAPAGASESKEKVSVLLVPSVVWALAVKLRVPPNPTLVSVNGSVSTGGLATAFVKTNTRKLVEVMFVALNWSRTCTMIVFVVGAVGCQVNRAALGAVLLLVMLAPAGPPGSVQLSELAEKPTMFVTEAVIVKVVPGEMFVSPIGLITSGPTTWPYTAEQQIKTVPRTKSVR